MRYHSPEQQRVQHELLAMRRGAMAAFSRRRGRGRGNGNGGGTPIVITGLADIVDNDTLKAAMGAGAPDGVEMWKGDDAGSPHANLIGTDPLTELGSVIQGATLTAYKGTPDGSVFSAASADELRAGQSATCGPGTNDFGVMVFWQDTVGTSARNMFSKKDGTSSPGWGINVRTTQVAAGLRNQAGNAAGANVFGTFGSGAHGAYMRVRQSDGKFDVYTTDGNTTDSNMVLGDYTSSSVKASVGDNYTSSTGFDFAVAIYFQTSLPTETHFTNLAAAIIT